MNTRVPERIIAAYKVLDAEGKTVCYQGFIVDLTEEKKLEAALLVNSFDRDRARRRTRACALDGL